MFLLAGLGNPGDQYVHTRHNAGYIAIDAMLAELHEQRASWQHKNKFQAELAISHIGDHQIVFCKPLTFMNLSGRAVASIAAYYRITCDKVIIIHDDLEVKFGAIKHKFSGSAAGHNGLKSITSNIGANYHRLRIGIGRPKQPYVDISDYVLSNLTPAEYQQIENHGYLLNESLPLLLNEKMDIFSKTIKDIGSI